jgi:hypothetical protein
MNSDRSERVFLVRLWREGDSGATRAWRGSVHDVSLGPKRYITAAQEIAEFVTLRLAATEEPDAHSVAKSDNPSPRRWEQSNDPDADDEP